MTKLFTDPLLNAARQSAFIAAHRMAVWGDELTVTSVDSKDGKNDLVTAADSEIESLVRDRLSALRPTDVIVGEEGVAGIPLSDHAAGLEILRALDVAVEAAAASGLRVEQNDPGRIEWHVDPIDGTVNFVRGIEHYCFSAGARLLGSDPAAPDEGWVAGLVAAPLLDRVWFARDGRAWVTSLAALTDPEQPIEELTGSSAPTTGRVVATGFGYAKERRDQQIASLSRVMDVFDDVRRCGSAAIDLCMAAEGRVNAYYERGLGVYDFAGGAYIAQAAGRYVHRRADAFLRDETGATIQPPVTEATSAGQPLQVPVPAKELTVVADTRERFDFLLAHG